MKFLKTNNYLIILLFIGLFSCENNSIQIKNYKSNVIDEMLMEIKYEDNILKTKIEKLLSEENRSGCMPTNQYIELDLFKNNVERFNIAISNKKKYDSTFITNHFNQLIYNSTIYREGKNRWEFDTINHDVSNLSPRDTMTTNKILKKYKPLNHNVINDNLVKLTLLQSNNSVFAHWIKRMDGSYYCNWGGNMISSNLHYEDKVVSQNEIKYIVPGFFDIDFTKQTPTFIFKENSDQFIMENGEKKVFTNPITLKASSEKGLHTVKGIIMIKQRGELVPKPFEFRYIVD